MILGKGFPILCLKFINGDHISIKCILCKCNIYGEIQEVQYQLFSHVHIFLSPMNLSSCVNSLFRVLQLYKLDIFLNNDSTLYGQQ